MTTSLREYKSIKSVRLWFDYPLHVVDTRNILSSAKYGNSGSSGVGKEQTTSEDWSSMLEDAFNNMTFDDNEAILKKSLQTEIEISDSNLKKYTGSLSGLESATLEDGERVVIKRGKNKIRFGQYEYSRPQNKNARWLRVIDEK